MFEHALWSSGSSRIDRRLCIHSFTHAKPQTRKGETVEAAVDTDSLCLVDVCTSTTAKCCIENETLKW